MSGIVKATVIGFSAQTLQNPQFRVQVCSQPKCVKQKEIEGKLRGRANWQWALKKMRKTNVGE